MTTDHDFKLLVRARMSETRENYTAARAELIAEREEAERFYAKTMRSFFRDGRLTAIPTKRRARVLVLLALVKRFDAERSYPEREVNDILRVVHDDVAYLRRELVDYGLMTRADGIYRVAAALPEAGPVTAAEFPPDAARRFEQARRAGAAADH